jgi:hypothetical protein
MSYWGGSYWGGRYWGGLYWIAEGSQVNMTARYASRMSDKIYAGNTLTLVVDCEVTISAADHCYLYVIKPAGTATTWTATAASSTCMVYTTTSLDFADSGIYKINAYVQNDTSTTYNFTGDTFQLRVYSRGE